MSKIKSKQANYIAKESAISQDFKFRISPFYHDMRENAFIEGTINFTLQEGEQGSLANNLAGSGLLRNTFTSPDDTSELINKMFKKSTSSTLNLKDLISKGMSIAEFFAFIQSLAKGNFEEKPKNLDTITNPSEEAVAPIVKPTTGVEGVNYISYDNALSLINSSTGKKVHCYIVKDSLTENLYIMFYKSSFARQYATSMLTYEGLTSVIQGPAKYLMQNNNYDKWTKTIPATLHIWEMTSSGGYYLINIDHNDTPSDDIELDNVTPPEILQNKFGGLNQVTSAMQKLSVLSGPLSLIAGQTTKELATGKVNVELGELGEATSQAVDLYEDTTVLTLIPPHKEGANYLTLDLKEMIRKTGGKITGTNLDWENWPNLGELNQELLEAYPVYNNATNNVLIQVEYV